MRSGRLYAQQKGVTLVELVVAIVLIGTALAGILGVMTLTTRHSADPAIVRQAVAIAEAYMEEILLRPIGDPDGLGPEPRPDYDDVDDYDGLTEAPTDQGGNAIGGLGNYTVSVAVTNPDALNGVPAARIAVRVQHPGGVNFTLNGWRLNW